MRYAALILLPGAAMAFFSVQQDWSGGPGVAGPVDELQYCDCFLSEASVHWESPGFLTLEQSIQGRWVCRDLYRGTCIAALDADGDGRTDLAVMEYEYPGSVLVFRNDPGVLHWPSISVADGFRGGSLVSGDLDGDGKTDLAGSSLWGEVAWWSNSPGPGWPGDTILDTGSLVRLGKPCDLDDDGDADLPYTCPNLDLIGWLENNSSGEQWTDHLENTWMEGPEGCSTGDLDGDGSPELVVALNDEDRVVSLNISRSDLAMGTVGTVQGAYDVAVADFNEDGAPDILAVGYDEPMALWFENLGEGSDWEEHQLPLELDTPHDVEVFDLDGDSDMDAVIADRLPGMVRVYRNLDAENDEWVCAADDSLIERVWAVAAADLDGDGMQDVAASGVGAAAWWPLEPPDYPASGELVSTIFVPPIGTDYMDWGDLTWISCEPQSTEIGFQLRASDDPDNMGEWCDTIYTQGTYLGDYLPTDIVYIQYRVILSTSDPQVSPMLDQVEIGGWIPGETVDSRTRTGDAYLRAHSPAERLLARGRTAPDDAARLTVFNTAGRIVARETVSAPGGEFFRDLGTYPAGVYAVLMETGGYSLMIRVVLIH